MSDKVGLIGVGALGLALLKRLRAAGKTVQAYDIAPTARRAAEDAGAVVVESPAAAAKDAAYIHVIVASDEQTLEATTGPQGLLAEARRGALVFLHSTTLPTTTKTVAEAAAAKGVAVLDATITGIPRVFEAGQGIFYVGGPKATVDAARGHLMQLGTAVHHFGPLGAGNVAKLAKNLYNGSERVLLAEMLNLAEAGGLDLRQFLDVLVSIHDKPAVAEWADNFTIENGHAVHRPTTNLFRKDVMLAAELSEIYRLDAPLTAGVARTARQWVASWAKLPKSL